MRNRAVTLFDFTCRCWGRVLVRVWERVRGPVRVCGGSLMLGYQKSAAGRTPLTLGFLEDLRYAADFGLEIQYL